MKSLDCMDLLIHTRRIKDQSELNAHDRSENIYKALNVLRFNPKHASRNLEKLLLSAINNWEQKNDGEDPTEANLVVKEIFVDSARMLKRIQAAPQGRAHRIRKRSNHVTIIIDKG